MADTEEHKESVAGRKGRRLLYRLRPPPLIYWAFPLLYCRRIRRIFASIIAFGLIGVLVAACTRHHIALGEEPFARGWAAGGSLGMVVGLIWQFRSSEKLTRLEKVLLVVATVFCVVSAGAFVLDLSVD